jgi:hypothetical protein
MARLFSEGFEFGDMLGLPVRELSQGTLSTSGPRSGNYCLLLNTVNTTNRFYVPVGDITEVFVRFGVYTGNLSSSFNNRIRIRFYSGGTELAEIGTTNGSQYFAAKVGGSTVATATLPIELSKWQRLDFRYKLDDTVGVMTMLIDGLEALTFTGDTKPGSETTFNRVNFEFYRHPSNIRVDDIAINDTTGSVNNSWCGDGKIVLIKPNAAGDRADFINSAGTTDANYTFVDEIPSDGDTTYVYPSTDPVGEYDLYNLTAPSLPSNAVITNVWGEARAKAPTTDYGVAIRLRGTTDTDGDTTYLGSAYQQLISDYYTTNDESEPWEETDVDDLQAGVVIK